MAAKKVYKSQKKSTKTPATSKPKQPATTKKSSPTPSNSSKSYKEYITEALTELKGGRKGVSRIALKKHLKENNPSIAKNNNFDHFFNLAIKKGVTDGFFEQPKGPSGTLKLVKKSTSPSPSVKKVSTPAKKVVKKTVAPAPVKKSVKKVTKTAHATSSTPTYKVMVIQGVDSLNQGKGSSRIALKKYVKGEYLKKNGGKEPTNFDSNFNKTVKKAVDDGYLSQPKGPSGLVKILKKGKTFVSAA
ncbi:histone H1 [Monosporozyma unispora]|nr:hypothetical protein C6P44_001342 [Kazachstania unispora]